MTSSIQVIRDRLNRDSKEPGELSMPVEIRQEDLESLGDPDRARRRWWKQKRTGYELVEGPPVPDLDHYHDNEPYIVVEIDDRTYLRTFTRKKAGAYQALLDSYSKRGPYEAEPVRAVDALGLAGELVNPAGRPAVRGAEVLKQLRQARATARLAADGEHYGVSCEDGRPAPKVAELLRQHGAERFIVGVLRSRLSPGELKAAAAYAERLRASRLAGDPPSCEWTAHKTLVPAVSWALGGAFVCAECLATIEEQEEGAA